MVLLPKTMGKNDKKFLIMANLIREYTELTGSNYIPSNLVYKGYKVGQYVTKTIRPQYKKGKLADWKIKMLNEMNFVWDEHERKNSIKFKTNVELLKEAREKGLPVPKSVKKYFDEVKGYSKVKGTRYYLRYLHISQYVDLDTYTIICDDYENFEKEAYTNDFTLLKKEKSL